MSGTEQWLAGGAPRNGEIEPKATRWVDLRYDELKDAICEKWHGFQRRTLADAWDIGRGLRRLKDQMQHGEWLHYLKSINIEARTAQRFMALAKGLEIRQLGAFASVDDALKSLPPKRETPDPASKRSNRLTCPTCNGVDPKTCVRCTGRGWLNPDEVGPPPDDEAPKVVDVEVVSEQEAEAAMADAAAEAEAERDPVAEKDERDERLAQRLEGTSGDAVDVLSAKLDARDEQHKQDVIAVNAARENAAFDRRKLNDVRDALLAIPRGEGDKGVDDVLARFFGVARK